MKFLQAAGARKVVATFAPAAKIISTDVNPPPRIYAEGSGQN
jgi:hypothetical protein